MRTKSTHLVGHLLHDDSVALADATLMVAEHGDETIRPVVGENFVGDRGVLGRVLELLDERPRGVVGTEDLGGKAQHVGREVLVDEARLRGQAGQLGFGATRRRKEQIGRAHV